MSRRTLSGGHLLSSRCGLAWMFCICKPCLDMAGLEMVQHYAQMVDDDLLQAHREHTQIDNLGKLK